MGMKGQNIEELRNRMECKYLLHFVFVISTVATEGSTLPFLNTPFSDFSSLVLKIKTFFIEKYKDKRLFIRHSLLYYRRCTGITS